MKLTKRIIALVLACLIFGGVAALAVDAPENTNEISDARLEKLYQDSLKALEKGDYIPGQVVVALKVVVAGPIDPLTPMFVNAEDYYDLIPELAELDIETIRIDANSLMRINLADKSGEAILEAIDLLQNNTVVAYATPGFKGGAAISKVMLGDVDDDGSVSNSDLIIVARCVVNLVELKGYGKEMADVNHDGIVTNSDLIAIAKMLVGVA